MPSTNFCSNARPIREALKLSAPDPKEISRDRACSTAGSIMAFKNLVKPVKLSADIYIDGQLAQMPPFIQNQINKYDAKRDYIAFDIFSRWEQTEPASDEEMPPVNCEFEYGLDEGNSWFGLYGGVRCSWER